MQAFNHSFSHKQDRRLKPIIQLPKIDLHESTLDVSLLDVMAIEDFLSLLKSKTEPNWKDLWKETCIFSKQLKAARELLSIGSNLISNKSSRKILDRLVDVTHTLLSADRVTILELDSTGRELIVTHSRDDKLAGFRIPATAGIEGEVLERKACANAADLYQDPRFVPALETKLGLKTRNAACAPIVAAGSVVGVILAVNKLSTGKGRSPRDPITTGFSANEMLLLGFIAANIGLALKQTTVYRSLSNHTLTSTLDLHKSMDFNLSLKLMKLENDKSLQGLIEFAYNKLDAERISIFTYSASSKSLVCAVSPDIKGFSIPHDKGFAGLCFTAMRLINIANTQSDERHNKDIDNHVGFVTRNLLCAPIVSQEGIALGVIQAVNKKTGSSFTFIDEEQINEVCRMMVALLKEKAEYVERNNMPTEENNNNMLSSKLPSITFARCIANMVLSTSLSELIVETDITIQTHTDFNFVRLYIVDGDRLFRIPPSAASKANHNILRTQSCSSDPYDDYTTQGDDLAVEQYKLTDLNLQMKQALQFSTMVEYKKNTSATANEECTGIMPGKMQLQHGFIMPIHAKAYPYSPGSCVLIVGQTKQSEVQVTESTREIMETVIEYFAHSINTISERYLNDETMKQMRNQFHLLYHALGALEDYVIILNGEGKFVGCNKCVEDIFGNMNDTDTESCALPNSTYWSKVTEGTHYSEWISDINSPELVRDINNALQYRESKCLQAARLTSSMYPDGISVDYQVTAVANSASDNPIYPSMSTATPIITTDQRKCLVPTAAASSSKQQAAVTESKYTDSSGVDIDTNNPLIVVIVIHLNTRRSVLGAAFESAVKAAAPMRSGKGNGSATGGNNRHDPHHSNRHADHVIDLTSLSNGVDAAEQIVSAIRNSFVLDEDVELRLKETMESLSFTKRRMSIKQSDPSALALAVQSANCLLVDPTIPLPKDMFEWEFNVILIKDSLVLCNIMGKYFETLFNLDELGVDTSTLARFIAEVGRHYHDRPFHNLQHATCVTHFTFMLIRASEAPINLKIHQVLALLISAVVHDVDHPGNTNAFEVNSASDLAIRYNDQSVLENHHCSTAFRIMRKPHLQVLGKFPKPTTVDIRKTIISCVMATDMAVHFELIDETKKRALDGWNFEETKDQLLLGKILLHAADLSNPVRPFHMTKTWAQRISVEFNDQVKREQALGMPVLGFMATPDDKALCKNETGFASFVVAPMWRAITQVFPQLHFLVEQLEMNLTLWKGLYEEIVNNEEKEEEEKEKEKENNAKNENNNENTTTTNS